MIFIENYVSTGELGQLEVICAFKEPRKLKGLILMCDVFNSEVVEPRRINLCQEALQILTTTFIVKLGESGKNDLNWGIC